jgi:hypothetical protein
MIRALRSAAKKHPVWFVAVAALGVCGFVAAIVKLIFAAGGATLLALLRDSGSQVAGGGLPGAAGAGAAGGPNPYDPDTWDHSLNDFYKNLMAQGKGTFFVPPGGPANVYSGPSSDSNVLGHLPPGASVTGTGKTGDGAWTIISTPSGGTAYMPSSSLDDHRAGAQPIYNTTDMVSGSWGGQGGGWQSDESNHSDLVPGFEGLGGKGSSSPSAARG